MRALNLFLSFYLYSYRKWLQLPALLELNKEKLLIKKKKLAPGEGHCYITNSRIFPILGPGNASWH